MGFDSTELIKGNNGKLSAMRLGFLTALLFVLLNWTYVNFTKKELLPIPENAVTLIIGLAGAKAVQRFGEKPPTEAPSIIEDSTKTP